MSGATVGRGAQDGSALTRGARARAWWLAPGAQWKGIAAFAVLITFLACRCSALLSGPEFAVLDALMLVRGSRPPDPRIVLVGIEEEEAELCRRSRSAECACGVIARDRLADLVVRLKRGGAAVVGVDLTLTRPCPVGAGTGRGHDASLARALAMPGETVIVAEAEPGPEIMRFREPSPEMLPGVEPLVASPVLYNPRGVIRGVRLVQPDEPTRIHEADFLGLTLVAREYPALCSAVYGAYAGSPCEIPVARNETTVHHAGLEAPVWASESIHLFRPIMPGAPELSRHAMLINWAGPADTFPMYGMGEVRKRGEGELRRRFEGRMVLVGSLSDRKHTPMPGATRRASFPHVDQSGYRTMSGLEIHANGLDTLLQRRFIRPISVPAAWALIFACCLLTVAAFARLRPVGATGVAGAQIGLLFAAAMLLIHRDLWLYTVLPATVIVVSGALTGVWCYASAWRRASALAEEVEARDAVTETIVHDLKQPLSTIAALAAALRAQRQESGVAAASPELLKRIQEQVEGALGDIDELLATSPHAELHLRPQDFDLVQLARDLAVAQSMRSPLHAVQVRAPDGQALISADPRYIGRAINNLMDNAIKYWPEGGTVVVEVRLEADAVIVKVVDNGLGMTREQQSRLFSRFARVLPQSADIPGAGIGLYSVRRIVEAHGGTIEVHSEQGVGSTFAMILPR